MFDDPVEDLVHLYVDGAFDRRELLRRVAKITGSAATAAVAVAALAPQEVQAECADDLRVPEDAPDVESILAEYPGEAGRVYGYLSLPRREFTAQMPAVVVIHENRGLTDHIKDVNRRIARAGFVGLAVDLLSRQGGTHSFADPAQQAAAYRNVTAQIALEDTKASIAFLRTLGIVRADRIGAVGFCAGGGNVWSLAANQPDLNAAVVYYGAPARAEQIENIQAAMLLHYAETDRGLTAQMAPALTALLDRRKTFALHVYEGVGHAFNNDTGAAFNRTAACEAWNKTLDFFNRHLRKPD
jgi:carboxymethylenebutenolidase